MFTIAAGLIGVAFIIAALSAIATVAVNLGISIARDFRTRYCGRR